MDRTPLALLENSVEAVAGSGIDIVPEFFDRFYAAWPEQRDNFNRPGTTYGAMVNEMLSVLALLAGTDNGSEMVMADCIARHHSYGQIAGADFASAVRLLMDTMRHAAGSAWQADHTNVWEKLLARLDAAVAHVETLKV